MQALVLRHIFSFIFSSLLVYYLVPLLIKSAYQLGFLDKPDGRIKVHKKPVPYFGGVAVYLGFVASLALTFPFENTALWLLLGVTLLLFIGLIDDFKVLKPGQKFFGQFIAVLCFLKGGFYLKTTFFSSALNLFLSGFWMMSVINAYNLVDVMDGLSSTLALVPAVTFLGLALYLEQYLVSLLLTAFIGAVFAFFLHNRPPAKIYLGDAGALFVGGFLSAMPLLINWSGKSWDSYYAPAIILGIPLLEVFFLVIIRTMKGIPFYWGSPHHFCIYLQNKGWSRWRVLLFSLIASSMLSCIALAFFFQKISFSSMIISNILFCIAWCMIVFSKYFSLVRKITPAFFHKEKYENKEIAKHEPHSNS